MSTTLVRGPVCGINNCRSRLWRTIEGRPVCQYGHIKEGVFEIEDDGEAFVATKRLTVPTFNTQYSQVQYTQELKKKQEEENQLLYGLDANRILIKCFQHLLKIQIKWLIDNKNLPLAYETVVKDLWTAYLESLNIELFESENDEDNEGISDTDVTFFSEKEMEIENGNETISLKKRQLNKTNGSIQIIHLVGLCYLGCNIINFPLFANDFIRLSSVNKLPYLRTLKYLPQSLIKKLPSIYSTRLEASKAPMNGEFYFGIATIFRKFQKLSIDYDFFQNVINYDLILLRYLKDLSLPMELFKIIKNFIKNNEISLKFEDFENMAKFGQTTNSSTNFLRIPEIKIICLITSWSKIYFLLQNFYQKVPGSNEKIGLKIKNWKSWLKNFYKIRKHSILMESLKDDDENFDYLLNYASVNAHKKDELDLLSNVLNLDFENMIHDELPPQFTKYLKWIENILIKESNGSNFTRIAENRLKSIFNLNDEEIIDNDEPIIQNEEITNKKDYQNIYKIDLITQQDLLKIEDVLITEFCIIFGLKNHDLKIMVNSWSDRLIFNSVISVL